VAGKSSKRKETIDDSGGGGLSKGRAKAQKIREAEFVIMLGLSTLTEREKLEKEIVAQVRIIASNRTGLELTTLSSTDRRYLEQQIEVRSARLQALRKQLAALPN
jgi:hypothetical protein